MFYLERCCILDCLTRRLTRENLPFNSFEILVNFLTIIKSDYIIKIPRIKNFNMILKIEQNYSKIFGCKGITTVAKK